MATMHYDDGTPFPGVVGRTMADSIPAYPRPPRPPDGAPNVIYVLLDDVGFAQFGCFGSDIETPTFDRLAAGGLRYRSFHTTAMCSPTRACLLTGRNHHTTGMGGIADQAMGFPGFNARIGKDTAFVSEVLGQRGYATFAVGKWHLAPREEIDLAASRRRWPLGRGFDRYYGFLGAETNQFAPDLVHDNHYVDPPKTPAEGYHLTEDLVDKALEFINDLRNVTTDKPFFLYLCPGACHAPHQAPADYLEHYRGRFDQGWDAWRDETLARQLAMGIVPAGTELTQRPPWIPAWHSLTDREREVYARMMEVYAAFLTHTDHQIGRLVDALEQAGELDNTLIFVMSDNGASPEGDRHGSFNINLWFNGVPQSFDLVEPRVEQLGGVESYGHYPYGWAHAGNTPFQKWKRETHEGGIADPLIVHWPAGIADRGAVRDHYCHAIDITPTVLDAAGIAFPEVVDGVPQKPVAGRSLLASLRDAQAPVVRRTQYYELLGCRAIYHDGWKAVAYHAMGGHLYDGVSDPNAPFDADKWELYHVADDFSESHDLAAAEPAKLRELVERWWVEAGRHGALPLHSRRSVEDDRPAHYAPRSRYVYRPGGPIATPAAVDVRHRSHVVLADVELPGDGVIVAHGGSFGGYALYVRDNRLHYVHNWLGIERYRVSSESLPAGRLRAGYAFTVTGRMQGRVELFADGRVIGAGDIARTTPFTYSLFGENFCIGHDDALPVDDYPAPFAFSGTLHEVVVDVSGEPYRDVEREWEVYRASQ